MFLKRISLHRRRSKTRPKTRVELARRIPKALKRPKKVRSSVLRLRERRRLQQRAGEALANEIRLTRPAGPGGASWFILNYEPYPVYEKVDWKKEGF